MTMYDVMRGAPVIATPAIATPAAEQGECGTGKCGARECGTGRAEGAAGVVWHRGRDTEVPLHPPKRCPNVALWDHQEAAVRACMPASDTFQSGIADMDCGTGKSLVGVELIRRSRAPATAVTQHTLSVDQWVQHLTGWGGMERVMTLQDARVKWRPS